MIHDYYYQDTDEGKKLFAVGLNHVEGSTAIIDIDEDCEIIGSNVVFYNYMEFRYSLIVRFKNTSKLKTICDKAFGEYYEHANEFEFEKCPNLEEIGYQAFYRCGIKVLNLGNCIHLKQIKESAFEESRIEELILPKSLSIIGASAFNGCYKLRDVKIPPDINVTKIPGQLFSYSKLTSFHINSKVTDFRMSAFSNCIFIEDITLDNSNKNFIKIGKCFYSTDQKNLLGYVLMNEMLL